MRPDLERWIGDADALVHQEHLRGQVSSGFDYVRSRVDDFYVSLVGELFDRIRRSDIDSSGWARLGNALALFAAKGVEDSLRAGGVSKREATLFAAAAFYCGGYPASAHLNIRTHEPVSGGESTYRACFDLLARPPVMTSPLVQGLLEALRYGDADAIALMGREAASDAIGALQLGPDEWIPARLFEQLVRKFELTNIRAVLPDGWSDFWTPLVASLLDRKPASWEFFPSQISAIERGLLQSLGTFSLQMPTGAGKTALCETLLYWHARHTDSEVAVLIVPYRSLASELRASVVKRLNAMGISARCVYGGTVPSGDEVQELDGARVVVATPEALSGLIGADSGFFRRVSLVICDEGHLLDGEGRGVSLELLLARMRSREGGAPRFVFVSAIVPNIEEIHAWLGGQPESVVRSDYRPANSEFAVLKTVGRGVRATVSLEMHPHETPPIRFAIDGFLGREDFRGVSPTTGRSKSYSFSSVKAQAIAAARKALSLGAVAVFAANKRGKQGAVGLAEELIGQLVYKLPLPEPAAFVARAKLDVAAGYLELEYGVDWIGTQALKAGAVLHHGDIPQETREVVETLLRQGHIRLAICTSTLAEGVNLPIRTLVLYSVQRRQRSGQSENLLARDIKNLAGRAGRAGAATKGLVICANERQWPLVEQVAKQTPGEPVRGALRALVEGLRNELALGDVKLTNEVLESSPRLYSLVDGVDSTLIDLAAEEIGEDALVALAVRLADQTLASSQADGVSKKLLQDVFSLRARRVIGMRSAGRLDWIRETGANARILESVESKLLPLCATWEGLQDPAEPSLLNAIFDWAWTQAELVDAVRDAYQLDDDVDVASRRQSYFDAVLSWLSGFGFVEMAGRAGLSVDDMLSVHARVTAFKFQTLVEQGISILEKALASQELSLAQVVTQFPEHLRFGVPTAAGRMLAAGGVRHRRAAIMLGAIDAVNEVTWVGRFAVFSAARKVLLEDRDGWLGRLGSLVFENTLWDVSSVIGNGDDGGS